jgi:hypothetical protein
MALLERIEQILREAETGADGPMPHSSVRAEDFYVEACADIARTVRGERARRTARELMLAQPLDTPCGGTYADEHHWQLQEAGYLRTWGTEVDPADRTVRAFYSGTEDWSEDGTGELLACTNDGCGQERAVPDGWQIDYR